MDGWRGARFCVVLALTLTVAPIGSWGATSTSSSSSAPSSHTANSNPVSKSATAATHKTTAHKTTTHKTAATNANSHTGKKSSRKSRSAKKHGQQIIDSGRAREIQEALIRQHYLQGEPSGSWDSTTQAAMERYQADQGWQTKTTPDSRALIKLGLGPSHDHLLNPETAMTSANPSADPKAGSKPASPASSTPAPASNQPPQRP